MLHERQKLRDASSFYARSIMATIGTITVSWAGIELILTHLVVWHLVKNRVHHEKGWPRMLTFQLDYMKKHIETDRSIDPVTRAMIGEFRRRTAELNEFRVNIIHGVMHKRSLYTTEWRTHSVKIDGNGWRVIKKRFTHDEIMAKTEEISQLGSDLSPFVARVIGMPHPANSEYVRVALRSR